MVGNAAVRRRSIESGKRREQFIEEVMKGATIAEASAAVGIAPATYNMWIYRYEEFHARVKAARGMHVVIPELYDGSFVSFRQNYLRMGTTWFQHQIVDAIQGAKPGEVTLVLIPPEHGKTTLLEDWCTYKLVSDNSFRITVASETVDHGVKILGRVQARFEEDGPTPEIPRDFGPLAPQKGRGSQSNQVWGQRRFDIMGKRSDERDYSMSCVGLTGRVQGTRCDLLLLDDLQDVKSIDQSQKFFSIITQSFLSRPSMFGRTVIIGTRVGEFDVYRHLMDANIPDKVVRIAAYNPATSVPWPHPKDKPKIDDEETWAPEGVDFLWPEMYDLVEGPGSEPVKGLHRFRYAALRYRVGAQTWERIYMQRPEAAESMTFDETTTKMMRDETRSVIADPRPIDNREDHSMENGATRPVPVLIAVDPAVGGGNGVISVAARPKRMEVLHCQLDYGLTKYSQIIDLIEEECHRFTTEDSVVTTVVIEDKSFQRGLLQDDRMLELQGRFGFRIVPNTTGREKADKDIGVPAMPMAMIRHEITIPWADEISIANMELLLDHLHMWRSGVNGVKLPQDLVMCLWFAYRQWRAVRESPAYAPLDTAAWRSASSPLRRRSRNRPSTRRYPHSTQRGAQW